MLEKGTTRTGRRASLLASGDGSSDQHKQIDDCVCARKRAAWSRHSRRQFELANYNLRPAAAVSWLAAVERAQADWLGPRALARERTFLGSRRRQLKSEQKFEKIHCQISLICSCRCYNNTRELVVGSTWNLDILLFCCPSPSPFNHHHHYLHHHHKHHHHHHQY